MGQTFIARARFERPPSEPDEPYTPIKRKTIKERVISPETKKKIIEMAGSGKSTRTIQTKYKRCNKNQLHKFREQLEDADKSPMTRFKTVDEYVWELVRKTRDSHHIARGLLAIAQFDRICVHCVVGYDSIRVL